MTKIQELEQELKKSKTRKSLYDNIKDTLDSSINEMKKTMSFVFSTPDGGKGQITKDLEKFEKNYQSIRKHN